LLREDHLQRQRRDARRHHQHRPENAVFGEGDFLGERMHGERHQSGDNVRDHQPAALAEKRRVRLVVNRRDWFGIFFCHERRKIRNENGSRKRI
jgi:hypothetical protein